MSVAVEQEKDVLKAIKLAVKERVINPILVGDKDKILEISKEIDFDTKDIKIINEKDDNIAAMKAVEIVHNGSADILMKGLVGTPIIMKAVLNKDLGLRTNNLISHVAVFDSPEYHNVFLINDSY